MESQENHPIEDLINLIGEITEYESELSDNNYLEILEVENRNFIEKFFNQKFKCLLKSDQFFSIIGRADYKYKLFNFK